MQNVETETSVDQSQVTAFYDQLIFPSKTSHSAYEDLVPDNLDGMKVGDFGCGQSLFIEKFRALGCDALFLDISPSVIERIDYGEKKVASLTDIPLDDDHMDMIFCIGVVHHIPEMEKAISELVRVLKPGGKLVLGVYLSGTAQAFLRTRFDNARTGLGKKGVRTISKLLIWLKNRKNGLKYNSEICEKRVDDLLITPLVRYVDTDVYEQIVQSAGGRIESTDRISQMSILNVTKAEQSSGTS